MPNSGWPAMFAEPSIIAAPPGRVPLASRFGTCFLEKSTPCTPT